MECDCGPDYTCWECAKRMRQEEVDRFYIHKSDLRKLVEKWERDKPRGELSTWDCIYDIKKILEVSDGNDCNGVC